MKAKIVLLLPAVVFLMNCGPGGAATVTQAGPHFANIDAVYLAIDYPKNAAVLKESYWDDAKTQLEQKLKKANLNISSAAKANLSKTDVRLIVRVELLKVPDVNLFAIRVETVMARQMLLATGSDQIFIVPLSLGQYGIRFVSGSDLPGVIEDAASQHIDYFLRGYEAMKSLQEKKRGETDQLVAEPARSATAPQQTQVAEYAYVASKNSDVFHKPDCRWAKNISPKNLVGYSTRDEAIEAGKRPCKWCKP